jgi:putative oxidoreductase
MTALRLATGGLMAGHGIQKLRNVEGTAKGFDFMGLRPGQQHAVAAGVVETAAGVGSMLGLWTPAASAATTGTMTVAIAKVHGKNGPWITKGGYEYNATLIAVAFALAAAGPGRVALDGAVTRRRAGTGWALAQLAVGALAGIGVIEAARRRTERHAAEEAAAADVDLRNEPAAAEGPVTA